jgi:hypothetical protein
MADRVCVDLASMLAPGEGMLVGSFSRALFLVHSEVSEGWPARPACLPACQPTCPPAHLPACLRACLPACLAGCLLSWLDTCLDAVYFTCWFTCCQRPRMAWKIMPYLKGVDRSPVPPLEQVGTICVRHVPRLTPCTANTACTRSAWRAHI